MHSNWDHVIGQDRVKHTLRTAILHQRIAHAYLFYGSAGVGKDALAIEFAKVLMCQSESDSACGECSSCKKMETLSHPNLKLIFPLPGIDTTKNEENETLDVEVFEDIRRQIKEKAANAYFHIEIPKAKVIPIRSIRAIKRESSMSGAEQGRRIFIIFDADAMKDEAANALLKVLEEPLEGVHFLLVTSRKDAVQPTVVSRCQLVRCSVLPDKEIAAALVSRHDIDEHRAHIVSRLANGNFTRAQELLGENADHYRNDAVQYLRSVLGSSSIKFLEEQDDYFTGKNRDNAEQLLMMLLVWFRDSLLIREGSVDNILNLDQETDLTSFVRKFGTKNLEQCMTRIERALELLRRNVYLPLVLLSLTVQLRKILHAQ